MAGSLDVNFVTVRIDDKKCNYCMECVHACTNKALTYDSMVKVFMHNAYECSFDEYCMNVCEQKALEILEM